MAAPVWRLLRVKQRAVAADPAEEEGLLRIIQLHGVIGYWLNVLEEVEYNFEVLPSMFCT